jgi:hypothetical protein
MKRDVRKYTTRHLRPVGGGGSGDEEAGGFAGFAAMGGVLAGMGVGGDSDGGRRATVLSIVLRRVLRFLLDMLNKVIIVLNSDILLFVCWLLLKFGISFIFGP